MRSAQRRHRLARTGFVVALIGLSASVVGLVPNLLPRSFSAAEQQRITSWEIGKRWRAWSAGQIFPATVPYELSAAALVSTTGVRLSAHLIGIAPQASCQSATDPAAWRVLTKNGCTAVLRATYQDSTGAFAVTIGIAAVAGDATAQADARALPRRSVAGVRAVGFGHTLAASFSDAARQVTYATSVGPYLIMSAVGYADGRHRVLESGNPYDQSEMLSVAQGATGWIGSRIGAAPPAPSCPGGPAC
jgi:hypothetical protein